MRLMLLAVAAAFALNACGQKPAEAPTDGESVRQRAQEAQTARRRTGAELQERALNRVIRTVYLCNNGERLSVDFDNPREMATVRNSNGEAVDLFRERAADGLWYRASGYELRGEGVMARWTADSREPTDCRAVD
ncbi:putative small lipoprotein YifL [Brevundimonas alba]|uniref:Putative small lipoprotein YifL n=1 Tax=Brevundimonas alba TaxID=74314 RepID=A0A7X5YLJ5_9CAUL|nr:MliC family protein [Brevundimonas alba]NJC42180.1 putative small lipoprotein YifL [Brevundimonas alba]